MNLEGWRSADPESHRYDRDANVKVWEIVVAVVIFGLLIIWGITR